MRALPLNDPRESALIRDSCLHAHIAPIRHDENGRVRVKCDLRQSHAEAIHRPRGDGCWQHRYLSLPAGSWRLGQARLTARSSKPRRHRFLPPPVHSPLRSSARAASPAPSSRWRRASRSLRRGSRYTVSGSQGMHRRSRQMHRAASHSASCRRDVTASTWIEGVSSPSTMASVAPVEAHSLFRWQTASNGPSNCDCRATA